MKRIFPAGVENDQAQLFDMARGDENPVQRHRLIVYVERAGQFRVDRDEVVHAAVFQTMSGIVDDGDVGVRRPIDEFTNGPLELDDAQIEPQIDNVESRFLQQGADRDGVVDRIRQDARVLVFAVADDERDPPLGQGRRLRRQGEPERKREKDQTPDEDAHRPTPPSPVEPPTCGNERKGHFHDVKQTSIQVSRDAEPVCVIPNVLIVAKPRRRLHRVRLVSERTAPEDT